MQRNVARIPKMPANPSTGIPDAYIDDVVRCYVREAGRIEALKSGDGDAWQELLAFLNKRVYTNLRLYRVPDVEFEALVADTVQDCASHIWLRLDHFPYDNSFEMWASRFVANEVRDICRSAAFRHRRSTLSLDQPIGLGLDHESDAVALSDCLPDEVATFQLQHLECLLVIEAGLPRLSRAQIGMVIRQLGGQTTADIAREMGCTTNAVYHLRQHAIAALRAFVMSEQDKR